MGFFFSFLNFAVLLIFLEFFGCIYLCPGFQLHVLCLVSLLHLLKTDILAIFEQIHRSQYRDLKDESKSGELKQKQQFQSLQKFIDLPINLPKIHLGNTEF